MPSPVDAFVVRLDRFLPDRVALHGSDAERQRHRGLVAALLLALAAVTFDLVQRAGFEDLHGAQLLPSLLSIVGLLAGLVAVVSDRFGLAARLVLSVIALAIVAEVVFVAGLRSPALPVLALLPLGATFLLGGRSGVRWAGLSVAITVALGLGQASGIEYPELPESVDVRQHVGAAISVVVQCWLLGALLLRQQAASVARLFAKEAAVVRAVSAGEVWLWELDPYGELSGSEGLGPVLGLSGPAPPTRRELLAAVLAEDRESLARRLAEDAPAGPFACEFRTASAPARWLRMTGHVRPGGAGDVGAVGVLADVTEERRRLAAREAYVADASHELRSPLSALHGALRLLGGVPAGSPEAAHLLRIADANSERALALVNDLLDLSRIDAGAVPVQLRRTSLGDVFASLASAFPAGGARLRLELPEPLAVDTDPARLEQVLVNLLMNAWRVSPPDGEVLLRGVREGDGVRLDVVDHGPGIPDAAREALFSRFHQVGGRSPGTGLGLAISHQLTVRLGGTLSVECPTSGGTVFSLRLPRSPPPPAG